MASWKAYLVVFTFCLTQAIGTPLGINVHNSPHLAPLKKTIGSAVGHYLKDLNQVQGNNNEVIQTLVRAIASGHVQYKDVLNQLPVLKGQTPEEQFRGIINNLSSRVPENQKAIEKLQAQLSKPKSQLNAAIRQLAGSSEENTFQSLINEAVNDAINIQNQGISLETGDFVTQTSQAVYITQSLSDQTTSGSVGQATADVTAQVEVSTAQSAIDQSTTGTFSIQIVENVSPSVQDQANTGSVDQTTGIVSTQVEVSTAQPVAVQFNTDSISQATASVTAPVVVSTTQTFADQPNTGSVDQTTGVVSTQVVESTSQSISKATASVTAPVVVSTTQSVVGQSNTGLQQNVGRVPVPIVTTTKAPSWWQTLVNKVNTSLQNIKNHQKG